MKQFLFSLLMFILVTPFVLADPAGWSNGFQITTNGSHSQASLATDRENNLRMVWVACDSNCNSPTPNTEIYYKSFDSNGVPIISDMRLTFNVAKSEKPSIVVDSEGNSQVIWEEYRNGNEE